MHCSYCWSKRHTLKNCPKTHAGSARRLYMRCSYCGRQGHTDKACPMTHAGNAARAWHPESISDEYYKD